ncbi:hypothetical protein L873DRAFT_1809646 [Choiromyces venosus 120613-1]|uniref:Uncharacterized protein n=1 Tax=Choiromyces venosus 120613-1 TaxID=1336337 RepID=A0A3N4JH38_9PEZI|nr:hypothetical protein L873DRAFT_1809646 [Choiromyces venosus 120613-1]
MSTQHDNTSINLKLESIMVAGIPSSEIPYYPVATTEQTKGGEGKEHRKVTSFINPWA